MLQSLSLALTSRFGSLPWMADSFFAPLATRFEAWLAQVEALDGMIETVQNVASDLARRAASA